jgi:hypothetical protein
LIARLAYVLQRETLIDDVYITLRYALNLLHGEGMVFNPGEPVYGASSPLYALLLSGIALVLSREVLVAILPWIGTLCLAGFVSLVWSLLPVTLFARIVRAARKKEFLFLLFPLYVHDFIGLVSPRVTEGRKATPSSNRWFARYLKEGEPTFVVLREREIDRNEFLYGGCGDSVFLPAEKEWFALAYGLAFQTMELFSHHRDRGSG